METKVSIKNKKNRHSGQDFENKVREDIKKEGWTVDRWTNNISKPFGKNIGEHDRKLIPALPRRIGQRIVGFFTGFPDFIAFKKLELGFVVYGIECKSNGYVNPEEKEKLRWLINNKIFEKIYIAKKDKKYGIIYKEVNENGETSKEDNEGNVQKGKCKL